MNNASSSVTQQEAIKSCTAQDKESRLPNIDELSSIFCNNTLLNVPTGEPYWSSTVQSATTAMYHGLRAGTRYQGGKNNHYPVRCVKR